MSSLRLALKQSLQESGGGTFGSGNGEKKKRKKHKNREKNKNSSNSSSKRERGRRPGDPGGVKRKRGRPRKHPRPDDNEVNNNNNNNANTDDGEYRQQQRDAAASGSDHPRMNQHAVGDVNGDGDNNDDEFYSENEFSYTEDDSDDDDDDDSQQDDSSNADDDDDEESQEGHYRHHKGRRRRSRTRDYDDDDDDDDDEDGDEEDDDDDDDDEEHEYDDNDDDMDDTTMHSDDEDDDHIRNHDSHLDDESRRNLHRHQNSASKIATVGTTSSNVPQQEQQEHLHQQHRPHQSNESSSKAVISSNEMKKMKNTVATLSTSKSYKSDEEHHAAAAQAQAQIRKQQRKLLKLKKKASAASKIQNTWKNKKKPRKNTCGVGTSTALKHHHHQEEYEQDASIGVETEQGDRRATANTIATATAANSNTIESLNSTTYYKTAADNEDIAGTSTSTSNLVDATSTSSVSTLSNRKAISTSTSNAINSEGGVSSFNSRDYIYMNSLNRKEYNRNNDIETSNPVTAIGTADSSNGNNRTITGGNSGDVGVDDDYENVEVNDALPTKKKKKKKKNNGEVPAPIIDVLRWIRDIPLNKSRKNISTGMRVKVRFATKVKHEGKLVKKKIWYGGKVTAVSAKRSKIRIKYDDGTSEISKFPDKDVVIDADMNGEHSVSADKFRPPSSQLSNNNDNNNNTEGTAMENDDKDRGGDDHVEIQHYDNTVDNDEGEVSEEDDEQKPKARHNINKEFKPTKNNISDANHDAEFSSSNRTGVPSSHNEETQVTASFQPFKTARDDNNTGKIPCTPPAPPTIGTGTSNDPAPLPEEGELSPGITVCKSSEFSESSQLDESTTFPVGIVLTTTDTTISAATSTGITAADSAASIAGLENKQSMDDTDTKEHKKGSIHIDTRINAGASSSSIPPKPPVKKLSIRIPSNSLASIKGFSSPRSSSKSPSTAAAQKSKQKVSSSNVDDILIDTPEQQQQMIDMKMKRKRISETTDMSTEERGQHPPPPKRRIKVTIPGKSSNSNTKTSASKNEHAQSSREIISIAAKSSVTNNTVGRDLVINSDGASMVATSSKFNMLKRTEEEIEEMELAPVAEPLFVEKKKKKKRDRAKSPKPRTKSPVSRRSSSPKIMVPDLFNKETVGESKQQQLKVGSKGSAFSNKKTSLTKENKSTEATASDGGNGSKQQPSLKGSVSLDSVGSISSRGFCRKAAQDAKEKLTVKEKQKAEKEAITPTPIEFGKKKKKRRRKEDAEAVIGGGTGGEESDDGLNETEWVQCDSCAKWRVLPGDVKVSSLPDLWHCHMNIYDPKRNSCEAPEQTAKQALKDRKRARKRAKRMEQRIEAAAESVQQHQKQETTPTSAPVTVKKNKKQHVTASANPNSPRPPKATKSIGSKTKESKAKENKSKETKSKDQKVKESKAKEQKESSEAKKIDTKKKTSINITISSSDDKRLHPSDSGSDTQKEGKKKGKKGKTHAVIPTENPDTAEITTAESKKPGRKRGRPANRSNQPGAESKEEDEDNVEWVQCDKCEKWRKLPPDISADELPDIWNCSMNTWKPSAASCDADEDKADAQHHEVGASEWQLRQTHAGKYSYRQMIFGTGARKHNRPMSERSRAAESLFTQPSTDEENPHPTTQYNKSSVFLPRMSNFQKANAVEEKTALGIFDVLQYSHLWEELRRMEKNPEKVLSSTCTNISGNINNQKIKTYGSLSDEIKHAMQDAILQVLDFNAMTGAEIIAKARWYPWDASITKSVPSIQSYLNVDIIINTLLDLVKDGIVEMATIRDPFTPMSKWAPKYRRVRTNRAMEAVEAIKASRCMKISKPWKQTEWITGQKN